MLVFKNLSILNEETEYAKWVKHNSICKARTPFLVLRSMHYWIFSGTHFPTFKSKSCDSASNWWRVRSDVWALAAREKRKVKLQFTFRGEDLWDGKFSNYKKSILQSTGGEGKLGKYPLRLRFTDEETETQKLDHLFHVSQVVSSKQPEHRGTDLPVCGYHSITPVFLPHEEQESVSEKFKQSAGWEFREGSLSGWSDPQNSLGRNIL